MVDVLLFTIVVIEVAVILAPPRLRRRQQPTVVRVILPSRIALPHSLRLAGGVGQIVAARAAITSLVLVLVDDAEALEATGGIPERRRALHSVPVATPATLLLLLGEAGRRARVGIRASR